MLEVAALDNHKVGEIFETRIAKMSRQQVLDLMAELMDKPSWNEDDLHTAEAIISPHDIMEWFRGYFNDKAPQEIAEIGWRKHRRIYQEFMQIANYRMKELVALRDITVEEGLGVKFQ